MGRRTRHDPGTGRRGGGSDPTELVEVYEGPEVLTALLQRAGSPSTAADVAALFQRAQGAGEERADVIPTLFPDEPRFEEPTAARRLYGNLFALWDRLASGASAADDAPAPVAAPAPAPPRPPPPVPTRGAASGEVLAAPLVEAVWKHLDALSERERRRLRDRFEGAQPDLTAWLDVVPIEDAAALAVQDLVFEAWAMFDVAFGDRLQAVEFAELRALAGEPPPLEQTQPALAAYVNEALDLVCEEEPTFGAAPRAQAERVIATVGAALMGALEPDEDA